MKKLITCLTAVLLVLGAQSLMAQSTTTTNSVTSPTPGEGHPGANPEQRKARMAALLRLLDLNAADMKALTPAERHAKMKERAEKIVADLQAKQTSGTLTDEQQVRLAKVQKWLAHAATQKKAAPPAESN